MNSINATELHELVRQGRAVDLIDVRTPDEYQDFHAETAKNTPLDTLDPASIMRGRLDAGQPLYVICKSGGRSANACEQFIAAGFSNVVNVEGGTLAWLEADLPAVFGEPLASRPAGASPSGGGCKLNRG